MSTKQDTASGRNSPTTRPAFVADLSAGLVVFLVALPLNLGIALASGAPLFSGLLAGVIGGVVVGAISGSHTSVSGPAAGLTAVVLAQIAILGSFETFLLAVVIGGLIQVALGLSRAGVFFAFVPSCVIHGLLAAIGVILILKQIPHVLGHDTDPEGEMSFRQPDHETTFSEIGAVLSGEVHIGAAVVGMLSLVLLILWARWKLLDKTFVPGALVVVLVGVMLNLLFRAVGGQWLIDASHLVQIPVADSPRQLLSFLTQPDVASLNNPAVYLSAATLAVVASLETLLNLEAVDRIDPEQRDSPQNRELIAQGVGNVFAGLVGGLPVTSVIGRSTVNINAGAQTRRATILHGAMLLVSVALLPSYLNMIPLAVLAAILLMTGFSLANPTLFVRMWREGPYQFVPFLATVVAIVFTDLLVGVLIGLAVSILFILHGNLRSPIRQIVEKHIGEEIVRIELSRHVSFLNRAAVARVLRDAPRGSHLLFDATGTEYIDPDVLSMIRGFKELRAPARGVTVSLRGFRSDYELRDEILFADYSTRELQDQVTPEQVLEILKEGNRRFRDGNRLTRDLGRQVSATASGQTPLAVVLSCIDSRVPVELVFDLGIGDVFSVRVAGNILGDNTLGSIEYGVVVSGVKLVVVLGHTRCGAVTSAVRLLCTNQDANEATGCSHLQSIVDVIGESLDLNECPDGQDATREEALIQEVTWRNIQRTAEAITARSAAIQSAVSDGRVWVVGALYDVTSGDVAFLSEQHEPVHTV